MLWCLYSSENIKIWSTYDSFINYKMPQNMVTQTANFAIIPKVHIAPKYFWLIAKLCLKHQRYICISLLILILKNTQIQTGLHYFVFKNVWKWPLDGINPKFGFSPQFLFNLKMLCCADKYQILYTLLE